MKKLVLMFVGGLFVIERDGVGDDAGGGILPAPATEVKARGTLVEELNVHSDAGIKLKTKRPLDFVTQTITIAPGGTTGWHSHPGPVLVTIKTGALTIVYASDETCRGGSTPGQSFVDRGDENVHTALNRERHRSSSGRPTWCPAQRDRRSGSTRRSRSCDF